MDVVCPHCGKALSPHPEQWLGKTVRCAACKRTFTVDEVPTLGAPTPVASFAVVGGRRAATAV